MSASDILVLILYVLPEWLQRGLGPLLHTRQIQVIGMPAWCQVFLYTSYSMRIMSVWMLVTSTVERYVGVCYPLKRRRICSIPSAKRIIATVIIASAVLTLWKPLMSESTRPDSYPSAEPVSPDPFNTSQTLSPSRPPLTSGLAHCAPRPRMKMVSFVLDAVYAASLSIIPSLIILCINMAISRRLLVWRKKSYESETDCISHQEAVGVQFAGLLVLISTTYLLVTWPYYICWIHLWYQTSLKVLQFSNDQRGNQQGETLNGALHVTRTIFYLNYSVNYFLYSFASKFFRSEMKRIFTMRARRRSARHYYESTEDGGQCVSHQRPQHTIEMNLERVVPLKTNYV